ncbi:PFD5 protein, partial [Atractosteus spatula]|nr:PFD5 protein [Atractosteus spatula]
MIVMDYQPFSVVQDKGFRAFINQLNPSYVLPNRKALTRTIIPQLYEKTLSEVQEKVKGASAVCLTTDCWTSVTHSGHSYLSVTSHFINPDFQMLTGWNHLPCFAHTIDLVVREALQEIRPTVDKVKEIVEYVRRSPAAAEKLRSLQKQMGMEELKLKQEVARRWNSTYRMLTRFHRARDAVVSTLALVDAALPTLTPEEWDTVAESCVILKPFDEAVAEITSEKTVSASKVIILARGLQRIAATRPRNAGLPGPVARMLSALQAAMSRRFDDIERQPQLAEASLLDPRFKRRAFTDERAAEEAVSSVVAAAGKVHVAAAAAPAALAAVEAAGESDREAPAATHRPVEEEVEFLTSSIGQLKVVQTKYVEAKDCLNVLNKANEGKELLVPLTSSMYVPGTLHDVEHVLLDVGTGYYVEKNVGNTKEFFKRKIDFLTKQIEKIQPALQEKHAMKQGRSPNPQTGRHTSPSQNPEPPAPLSLPLLLTLSCVAPPGCRFLTLPLEPISLGV